MAGTLFKFLCVAVACMVLMAPYAAATITCGVVEAGLVPCLPYLRSGGPVPLACCAGFKAVNAAATITSDRRIACGCLQRAYGSNSGINPVNAAALPGKCGVNNRDTFIPSDGTDCSTV